MKNTDEMIISVARSMKKDYAENNFNGIGGETWEGAKQLVLKYAQDSKVTPEGLRRIIKILNTKHYDLSTEGV